MEKSEVTEDYLNSDQFEQDLKTEAPEFIYLFNNSSAEARQEHLALLRKYF